MMMMSDAELNDIYCIISYVLSRILSVRFVRSFVRSMTPHLLEINYKLYIIIKGAIVTRLGLRPKLRLRNKCTQ